MSVIASRLNSRSSKPAEQINGVRTFALLAALAFAVLAEGSAEAQRYDGRARYRCKDDLVVGFWFEETARAWVPKEFRADKEYVLRRFTPEEMQVPHKTGADWGVFDLSKKIWSYDCTWPTFGAFEPQDTLNCEGFQLNLSSLRFQNYYGGGYLYGRDDNEDSPSIEIGRCNYFEENK